MSATKKVRFSPGNLQYQASSRTWRFAAHQWDYVGDDTYGNVSVGETKCDNSRIDESYSGWIDLFGWGTSGHQLANYGIAYQPWSTSETPTDYGPIGNYGLTGDYAEGDWGSAVASTLGSGWRTLSRDEWTYLLNVDGNGRTGECYCTATVNNVRGLVIFPDDYFHPSDVKVPDPDSVNEPSPDVFNLNTWDGDDWTKMESAGYVFLPAAGYRTGTSVNFVVPVGRYWSSTPNLANNAFALTFLGYSDVETQTGNFRYSGRSVRLVRDL